MEKLTFPIRGEKFQLSVEATDHLCHKRTKYQTIDIYETEVFGKVMLLDGHVQLTTFDERAYHECLVQIPLLNLPSAKKALVIGGGDGGAIRELCKHPSLEQIDLVEIDEEVIYGSKKFLPSVGSNSFDDPRVRIYIQDAIDYVHNENGTYDLIIMDSTDVYEDQPDSLSVELFSDQFYADCREALTESGVLVTQADNPVFCPYSLEKIGQRLAKIFHHSEAYVGLVPSFGGFSAFCYGAKKELFTPTWNFNLGNQAGMQVDLEYLNPLTYNLAFNYFNFNPFRTA